MTACASSSRRWQSWRPLGQRSREAAGVPVGPAARPTARAPVAHRRAAGQEHLAVVAEATPEPTRRWNWFAANPGITIPDIAKSMGIEPNYLYRVLPKLAQEGQLKRQGNGWHPAS